MNATDKASRQNASATTARRIVDRRSVANPVAMRIATRFSALFFALLAGGCGEASAGGGSTAGAVASTVGSVPDDVAIEVRCEIDEAPLGRAFDLVVVRTWSRDFTPLPFRPETLAPIVFVPESTTKDELRDHVRETIRGRAYVFSLDDVAGARASFDARPSSGGPVRTARSNPLDLRTTPALTAEDALDAESPGDLLAPPPRRSAVIAGVVFLACAAVLVLRAFRARAARRAGERPARITTAERFARLRERDVKTADGWDAFHVDVADVVRDHLADRHGLPAPRMTTEEIAGSPDAAVACGDRFGDGVALLTRCDAVKFAREGAASDAEAAAAARLATAERLVGGGGS